MKLAVHLPQSALTSFLNGENHNWASERKPRETEKSKYLYKTRTAMQQNPADVNAASSITEIARLITGISVCRAVVMFFNAA
jgi:hypothetical protein